jgi:hypothetical protein
MTRLVKRVWVAVIMVAIAAFMVSWLHGFFGSNMYRPDVGYAASAALLGSWFWWPRRLSARASQLLAPPLAVQRKGTPPPLSRSGWMR